MTERCLKMLLSTISLEKGLAVEVVVVDNASSDQTSEMLQKTGLIYKEKNIPLTIIRNSQNLGFSKGNNKGAAIVATKYILFLNSDVLVENISFKKLIDQMKEAVNIGVITVRVVLPDGNLDPASHRGFPTIWRSFSYYFGLEKLFGKIPILNKMFGGYHLTYRNMKQSHEIDSPTGAFYLVRKDVFDKVRGFDEDFFMYGEDLDLSYRIKKLGYKIMYDPSYTVTHLKYQSGLKSIEEKTKQKTRGYFYDAMRIFYDKHYAQKTPLPLNKLVHWIINRKAKHS